MQAIQLYIGSDRVELFQDESVTLTDSIQNVKDIDKVFTAFSKSFSVPASRSNNKLFKHYYNSDIVDGFDARKKVTARIELNNVPFRTGKIKLEGVDLKNNRPHTYRITFFGDIVELKDTLGEKKLSDLTTLSALNLDYDASTVYSKLAANPSTNDIICPLITHTQRLYYDSVNHTSEDGNLKYETGTGHSHGVHWNQLKYALRVNRIIQAIEDQFSNLQFSTDFFRNSSITKMNNLFMWLHRKSGYIEDLSGSANNYDTKVDTFPSNTTGEYFNMSSESEMEVNAGAVEYGITNAGLYFYTTSSTTYTVSLYDSFSNLVFSSGAVTGNQTFDFSQFSYDYILEPGEFYTIYINASSAITFSDIRWDLEYDDGVDYEVRVFTTGSFTTSSAFPFNVDKQMPDMKIIDFLTGLFKLFNLTAYVEDGTIIVKPLDDYYSSYDTYDITKYIDINSSQVDVALPYREITFKFKDTKTFLANKYGELFNKPWGELKWAEGEENLAGQLYKVEAPFGHMMFERITDAGNGTQKNIQWGYCVDNSQNPYKGEPLLFYPINYNTSSISFVDDLDADNQPLDHVGISYVNLPSNSVSFSSTTDTSQLNFAKETNEWTGGTNFTDTLFTEEYATYISNVFNRKQRLYKIKAKLPQKILLNYTLADRFIVGANKYKINSISTNLTTGMSDIELINDL